MASLEKRRDKREATDACVFVDHVGSTRNTASALRYGIIGPETCSDAQPSAHAHAHPLECVNGGWQAS
jgi:hypothetical protein